MVSIIKNGVLTLEGSVGGAGPATLGLKRSLREGHTFCVVESSCELSTSVLTYTNYVGKFFANLTVIFQIFTEHLPTIIAAIGQVMNLPPLRVTLGCLGEITSIFRLIKESLSFYRQSNFLSIFQKHAWTGENTRNALAKTIANFDDSTFQNRLPLKFRKIITGKKDQLATLLRRVDAGDQTAIEKADRVFTRWAGRNIYNHLLEISNLAEVEIERALPDWMNGDLLIKGGKSYLNNLLKRVEKGEQKATEEATKLIETMNSYAAKKRIFNALKIIGAAIGAISCIGFFVAFPWAVTVMFLVLIGICATTAYLYNSCYVENRENRFSLKLCVPEPIRNAVVAVGSELGNYPQKIATWINGEKPIYHPFFDRKIEIAEHRNLVQIQKSYSAERLKRRTRLAAQGILLGTPAAA